MTKQKTPPMIALTPIALGRTALSQTAQAQIAPSLRERLKYWQELRLLTPLDRHFALSLCDIEGLDNHSSEAELFMLICALLSRQLSNQHSCLVLSQIDLANPMMEECYRAPASCSINLSLTELEHQLSQFSAVGQAGDNTPLILDTGCLYLNKYHFFETHVAHKLNRLAQTELIATSNAFDAGTLNQVRQQLDCLFPAAENAQIDWQKVATATALTKALAVITGGPGTGKTTTVTKLLLLLQTQSAMNIKLVAPTGKAAARLSESIKDSKAKLHDFLCAQLSQQLSLQLKQAESPLASTSSTQSSPPKKQAQGQMSLDFDHTVVENQTGAENQTVADIQTENVNPDSSSLLALKQLIASLSLIPEEASTLHRLLGVIPNSHKFRHDEHNPLRLDLLVVDEASMVDLPMMHKLLSALPKDARLILLGDQDQLASVEAGAVLADICAGLKAPASSAAQWQMRYSHEQALLLEALTGEKLTRYIHPQARLGDSLCILFHSHRFKGDAGIGLLAAAVNHADIKAIRQVWQQQHQELNWFEHQADSNSAQGKDALLALSVSAYGDYLSLIADNKRQFEITDASALHSPKTIIDSFNQYRILCAMRAGEFGVDGINAALTQALKQRKLIDPKQEFYLGRPIIIASNDYNLGLFNGDIGLILQDKDQPTRLMAHFIKADGSVLKVQPARLPSHDTCYAMTVHKSQGSEFAKVSFVLPPKPSTAQWQLLTKELLYTAITRAKAQFYCLGSQPVFERASRQVTLRASGLARRLWDE
ncbi:exodeoxyribonuclease V, alpha subunit [Shewanella denitrificans OS217]|uniref:RecBCD enzyme subunit RecD n=1 Tax=Shewanella denitrificans (strain OS217 / ATCC BAA-1090 / DSM 15013) TaxID=318161 RepID=Q12LP3_SHEDO|nr:exodeoxyribonuclease V, alpha subunit [Shewanella denitrificans OS217]